MIGSARSCAASPASLHTAGALRLMHWAESRRAISVVQLSQVGSSGFAGEPISSRTTSRCTGQHGTRSDTKDTVCPKLIAGRYKIRKELRRCLADLVGSLKRALQTVGFAQRIRQIFHTEMHTRDLHAHDLTLPRQPQVGDDRWTRQVQSLGDLGMVDLAPEQSQPRAVSLRFPDKLERVAVRGPRAAQNTNHHRRVVRGKGRHVIGPVVGDLQELGPLARG